MFSDVNECPMSPCQHECHNTAGSYYCSCFPGYSLEYDQKTCKGNNEHSSHVSSRIALQ